MRVNLRPLTYWVIHEKYTIRFKTREPQLVQAVVTTADGTEMALDYFPESHRIELPDRTITINDGGWEVEATNDKPAETSDDDNAQQ